MRPFIGTTALVVLITSFAPALGSAAEPTVPLRTVFHDAAGREVGWARLQQNGKDILMRLEAKNLSPGTHGVHLHAVGKCDAPDFASAGGHWNPTGKQHGKYNSAGMHMGDLPNLMVESNGRGTLIGTISGTSLATILDADGAALVIHANADDYKTDPSGNSGARIACGVLGAS
jgi:superoxide dismutase, Cu-Zn family